MSKLPEAFLEEMRDLLKDELEAFLDGFDDTRRYGLKLNTAKISKEEFERIAPFHLCPIPWIDGGYTYHRDENPAAHPFYAAGLYYLQEPSAMTPASRLICQPGEKVLDLCAAPGGKATSLGAQLGGEGLLVANDINQARAKALLRNLELFGLPNTFVTNEAPHVLAERFPAYFDKIMVDAPCSGEGMFRKNPAVVDAWLEKGPDYFSRIQKDIILNAADMLKPGGKMFYSTCTFSPYENEAVISHLLRKRPEMTLIPMEDYEGFSEGVTSFRDEIYEESCVLCRRIWPHHMAGEGHFMALLMKNGEPEAVRENRSKKHKKKTKEKPGKLTAECREILTEFLSHLKSPVDPAEIDVRGDKVYRVITEIREDSGLHFLRNGVFLGELKKGRFEPSEPLALTLNAESYDLCIDFSQGDERLERYLRGESFDVSDLMEDRRLKAGKGLYLVTVEGYGLGFAKIVNNTLKNKYPVGWRK